MSASERSASFLITLLAAVCVIQYAYGVAKLPLKGVQQEDFGYYLYYARELLEADKPIEGRDRALELLTSAAADKPAYKWGIPHTISPAVYPLPWFVFLMPFSRIDYQTVQLLWTLLGQVALAGSLWMLIRLVGRERAPPVGFAAVLVGICALSWPVTFSLISGQVNFLVLALVVGMIFAIERRKSWVAGSLLGLAIAAKGLPAFLIVVLVVLKDWKAIAGAVLVSGLSGVLCLGVLGWDLCVTWLELFIGFQAKLLSVQTNISALSAVFRLGGAIGLSDGNSRILADVMKVCLTGWALYSLWLARNVVQGTTDGDRSERLVVYVGLAATWMCLISPLMHAHHLVWLLVPLAAVLVHFAASGPTRAEIAGVVIAVSLVFLKYHPEGLVGFDGPDVVLLFVRQYGVWLLLYLQWRMIRDRY